MRVLHAIPALGGGGAERQLSLLAPALRSSGMDVHVVYQHPGEYHEILAESGIGLHPLGLTGHRDPRLPHRLHRTLRAVNPDVVHTWLPVMDAVGGAVALAARIPWLLSERSVAAAYATPSLTMRARSLLAPRAAGVVANSNDGLAHWAGVFPAARRFLVPNAVPLAAIAAAPPLDRMELPLDPGAPLVVYAGRFSQEKNTVVLVAALVELARTGEVVAMLCGDGAERVSAEAAVRAAGVADRIYFAGYRADLWSVLKAADVVVSLSRFEGTPNVALEAAATGIPLLLSDIPAHRALFADDAADYVAVDDTQVVADTLREMLADRDRTARRARLARERVGSRDPVACARILRAAYDVTLRADTGRGAAERGTGALVW